MRKINKEDVGNALIRFLDSKILNEFGQGYVESLLTNSRTDFFIIDNKEKESINKELRELTETKKEFYNTILDQHREMTKLKSEIRRFNRRIPKSLFDPPSDVNIEEESEPLPYPPANPEPKKSLFKRLFG